MSKAVSSSSSKKKEGAGHWKSATDAKSGRVYYYNSKTRETTWTKPFELASPEEQAEMTRLKEEASRFFLEMEANIKSKFVEHSRMPSNDFNSSTSSMNVDDSFYYTLDNDMSVSAGDVMFAGDSGGEAKDYFGTSEPFRERGNRVRLSSHTSMQVPRMIRTISTIDDDLIEIMKFDERMKSSGVNRTNSESDQPGIARRGSFNTLFSNSPLLSHSDVPKLAKNSSGSKPINPIVLNPKTSLKRRNSTGTIYVGTTMSVQDNEATIKCVCVVIRAHIIEATKRNVQAAKEYDIFKDPPMPGGSLQGPSVPSLNEIKDFFMLVFSKSQLESECIIMALIYIERMIKETQGRFVVRHDNWKSILFACLVMASKVWDDLSMWNVDFSQISLSFNLQRVNALELAVLDALAYVIRVSASDYAKYYFHLRSMMARLGFHENEPNFIAPLDIKGARKLQLATERYQEDSQIVRKAQSMRIDSSQLPNLRLERHVSADGFDRLKNNFVTVGLEQITHAEHNDADGGAHTSRSTPRLPLTPSPRAAITNTVNFNRQIH